MPSQADIRTSIMQTILDTHASAEKTLPWRPTWIPCKHCLFAGTRGSRGCHGYAYWQLTPNWQKPGSQ